MKSIFVSLCLLVASATAADQKFAELLQPGKRCFFTLEGGSPLIGFLGPVTILAATSDGWVKIEYLPAQQPGGRTGKKEGWLNLSHVVMVEEASEFPAR
jgi:hypothetical protein